MEPVAAVSVASPPCLRGQMASRGGCRWLRMWMALVPEEVGRAPSWGSFFEPHSAIYSRITLSIGQSCLAGNGIGPGEEGMS